MADFASALHARLTGAAPVSAIVQTKVYWVKVPQDKARPYIRLQTISDPRPEHLQGYDASRVVRVQCDCFAETYAVARDLAEKVIAALATPATVAGVFFGRVKAEGPRDLGEDVGATFVHRASVDLLVEHRII